MWEKYIFKVFIFCVNSPTPPFLIWVSFDLKDIFTIIINIKNVIRSYYFILLWGAFSRGSFVRGLMSRGLLSCSHLPTVCQDASKFSPELWYLSLQVQRCYDHIKERTRKSTKNQFFVFQTRDKYTIYVHCR